MKGSDFQNLTKQDIILIKRLVEYILAFNIIRLVF